MAPMPKKSVAPQAKKASGGAVLKILNMAAALKVKQGKAMKHKLICPLTGIQGTSTICNALADLKKKDLMEITSEYLIVTDAGMEDADINAVELDNAPITNEQHQQTFLKPLKLGKLALDIFNIFKDGYNYSKADALKGLNKEPNSTSCNAFADLKKKDVIEYKNGGKPVQAVQDLFPLDPRPE